MIAQQPQLQATFQSASLYVGDLHPEVTEGTLFDMFNRVGPVASIRTCRDAVTRRSLGYAYVNFHNVQDAERSLDTMNFTEVKGRPCRIMWSQRDPSLRKSGVGNVFVKNLAPSVDNKALFDTFSVFGNILSCKVAMDEAGVSKGYGYVHYETAEAAQDAIAKFNGNFIEDLEVFVGPFVRRQERAATVNWTNLYVKQFPLSWDETKLRELFTPFGSIASVFLSRDEATKSRGFGFVNFTEHEGAVAAVQGLNGHIIPADTSSVPAEGADPAVPVPTTMELYVGKAQKRGERLREIKSKLDAAKEDRVNRFAGMNLYVKNIDDSVSDELFRETFARYGTVTSARIMRDPVDAASKGFGFVCFSSAEEAARAAGELNNKLLRSKPIVVTLHQRKDVRRAQLAATYAPRGPRGFPGGASGAVPLPYMPMYVPQGQQQGGYGQGGPRPFGGYQPGQQTLPGQQQASMGGYPPRGSAGPRAIPFSGPRGVQQGGGYYAVPGQQPGPYPGQPLSQQGPVGAGGYPQKRLTPGQPPQLPGQTTAPLGGPGTLVQQQQRPRPQNPMTLQPQVGTPRGMLPQSQPGRGYLPGMPLPQLVGQQQLAVLQQQQQAQAAAMGVRLPPQMSAQGMLPGGQLQGVRAQGIRGGPQASVSQTVPVLGEPLDDQALAAADPQMQKNMIGERLYPLIYVHQPALAGKITGMLLEMDNAELLNLIESPEALAHKIEEALAVLKNHQQQHLTGANGSAEE